MSSREKRPKKRGKRRGVLRTILLAGLFAAMAGGIALAYVLMGFGSYEDAKLHNDPQSTLIYDASGELALSVHGTQNRVNIGIEDVPDHLRDAFLAAEDLRFYEHVGFDVVRILGALYADIRSGSLAQGASTITQQLVKNTHLTPEKTWMRKLQEAYFAYQVEQDYTKDEILVMYMNHVYFGNGAYGVQAASQAYFGVDAKDLSLLQCASLAAILKAPSNYAPHIEPENNKRRRDGILMTMQEENMISAQEAEIALASELVLIESGEASAHGWFTDAALKEAAQCLGIDLDALLIGGYRIHTSMDSDLQNGLNELFLDGTLFPEDAQDGTPAQAALVAIDVKTGAVAAMMGGREYSARLGLNRALQAKRQPGSTLKPFAVYAPAIQRASLTSTTFVNDAPIDIDGYAPGNFGGNFSGWITARTALAKSLNIPAVILLNQLGLDSAMEGLASFGIPAGEGDRYLPVALGSMEQGVSPLDLCAAYAALGNGGERTEPYLVAAILGANGKILYEAKPQRQRAVDERTAYLLTDMLRSTALWGTGSKIGATGLTAAAKTGTVSFEESGNRDAWAVAYTPRVAIAVWMGFDATDAEHCLPQGTTGGSLPAALAARALTLAQQEDIPFDEPEGITRAKLDKRALEGEHVALLATEWTPESETVWETYIEGTQPTQYGAYWTLPQTPVDLRVTKGIGSYPAISFTALEDKARYRVYRKKENEEAAELIALRGAKGDVLEYVDNQVDRTDSYLYFVIPEHAEAVDMGVTNARGTPTGSVGYTVPLMPFDLPFNLDDLFINPSNKPEPTVVPEKPTVVPEEPTALPWVTLPPSETPAPTVSPSPAPMPSPTPIREDPLFLQLD